jgi:hypothetical protein
LPTPPPTTARRRLLSVSLIVALTTLVSACQGTWGIRSSFRSYVAGPAGGQITTHGSVQWVDAAGPGKGPFTWPVEWATFDDVSGTGTVQFSGGVTAKAHASGSDHVLDVSVWNPRLEIAGNTGTLVADLNYRPYDGTAPSPLPTLQAAVDVDLATVDLTGAISVDAEGNYSITNAPMVGIDAAMDLIGFDEFYGTSVALDPITTSFNPDVFQKVLAGTPKVTVSRTTGLRPGDKVIVWGQGFDPTANPGTRAPLSGQPAGAYVVFGKFAANWQPSGSAPSSTRTVIGQVWALPAASRAILDPTSSQAAYTTIDSTGRFETILTVGTSASANPNYGVYTYPGSGAVNAAYETQTLVTLAP